MIEVQISTKPISKPREVSRKDSRDTKLISSIRTVKNIIRKKMTRSTLGYRSERKYPAGTPTHKVPKNMMYFRCDNASVNQYSPSPVRFAHIRQPIFKPAFWQASCFPEYPCTFHAADIRIEWLASSEARSLPLRSISQWGVWGYKRYRLALTENLVPWPSGCLWCLS